MATALLVQNPIVTTSLMPKIPRRLTMKEFLSRYAKREDGFNDLDLEEGKGKARRDSAGVIAEIVTRCRATSTRRSRL